STAGFAFSRSQKNSSTSVSPWMLVVFGFFSAIGGFSGAPPPFDCAFATLATVSMQQTKRTSAKRGLEWFLMGTFLSKTDCGVGANAERKLFTFLTYLPQAGDTLKRKSRRFPLNKLVNVAGARPANRGPFNPVGAYPSRNRCTYRFRRCTAPSGRRRNARTFPRAGRD